MFLPPKNVIAICVAAACLFGGSLAVHGQSDSRSNPEYERRLAALQRARQRSQGPVARVSQAFPADQAGTIISEQIIEQPTQATGSATRTLIDGRRRAVATPARFQAGSGTRQLPLSQGFNGSIINGGSPIVSGQPINGSVIGSSVIHGSPVGETVIGNQVLVGQPVVDDGYSVGCADGSCGAGGCSDGSCGAIGESYFDDNCCGRGGCPSGSCGGDGCWPNRFGRILRRTEFFGGFTSFRSPLFQNPTGSTDLVDDSSHGLFSGFNIGVPLCRLTCGLVSGQFGLRSVNSNFNGAEFTADDRNQVFLTAGFFRRVDQGLQFGLVTDYLREEWFTSLDVVQLRGDIGYVWPNGTTFGFRFATNLQDDPTAGFFDGQFFSDNLVSTNEWNRFYLRHDMQTGGFGEFFAGWTDNDQGIVGLAMDFPVRERLSVESGFTYFIGDQGVPPETVSSFIGGDQSDAFNVFVGFSLRPAGVGSYRSYDRPLFDVADNGTLSLIR